jgi:hypothetical protein
MNQGWANRNLTNYLDGEMGPAGRWVMRRHLVQRPELFDECESCEAEGVIGGLMRQMRGAVAPPADLGIRLKVAVSKESSPSLWQRSKLHLRNLLEPLAVPATGGILAAVLSIWIVVASLGSAPSMFSEDVPLSFFAKAFIARPEMSDPSPFSVTEEAVVLAFIDGEGAVYDFRVIYDHNQPANPKLAAEVAKAVITSRFIPAMNFGRPVLGTMLITLRPGDSVEVRG